ncbi:glycosyltransferase family 2 protein [Streptomyces lasalocidi]
MARYDLTSAAERRHRTGAASAWSVQRPTARRRTKWLGGIPRQALASVDSGPSVEHTCQHFPGGPVVTADTPAVQPSEEVLISVVLPVYRVQEYLPECLDSILGASQSFRGVEVVAVDDCSPDDSGALLDAYAAQDQRLRVVHLPQNVGLGRARSEGLARAKGDYVWFVDSDDRLTDGALAAVAARLRRTEPDVLLVDHALVAPDGAVERNVRAHQFRGAPETFTLAERPGTLDLIMTAWSRVLRREFLLGLDLEFGHGYYEDISVTYPVLLAARRLPACSTVSATTTGAGVRERSPTPPARSTSISSASTSGSSPSSTARPRPPSPSAGPCSTGPYAMRRRCSAPPDSCRRTCGATSSGRPRNTSGDSGRTTTFTRPGCVACSTGWWSRVPIPRTRPWNR